MERRVDLETGGKVYNIRYDEYGELDTVHCEGKALSTKNRVVKRILNNADTIYRGFIPTGFNKVRK